MKRISRFRRPLLAALIILLAAITTRAQAPEFGYWEPSPLPIQGLATYYNPGIMEYVQEYRLRAGDIDPCPECVGSIALLRAGDIGRKVWLQPPSGDPVGPFLVVDCARRQDVLPLLQRNWVVDVSYEIGQYWGMNRPLDGVIVFEDPADTVPGRVINRIPTPFAVVPSEVIISPPTLTPEVAVPAGFPTPWPTRQPYPLNGAAQIPNLPAEPTATTMPPTATAIWPPPLTPVITTPTSVVPRAFMLTPQPTGATVTPVASPTEVALGRAGGELLLGTASFDGAVSPATAELLDGTATPHPFPTARPTLARTPRPNLTPILPVAATRAPAPTPDPSLLDRILRELLDLVR